MAIKSRINKIQKEGGNKLKLANYRELNTIVFKETDIPESIFWSLDIEIHILESRSDQEVFQYTKYNFQNFQNKI